MPRTLNSETGADGALYANTAALAFLGDAVYELRIRIHVAASRPARADQLHRAAASYVRASAQAKAMNAMLDGLSEEELRLVKRARNKKTKSKPRNADPVEYKWATAFEALLGYYCISGREEKLEAAVAEAIRIIDEG
jgi:ribonuclease-3 family protein